jgi:glycosyltransferase involved in cell wall biosynthesis
MLDLCLLTLGDPRQVSGGYRYHLRMAEAAAGHGARVEFVSLPLPTPRAALAAPLVLRTLARRRPDALLVDSIAACFCAPWLSLFRPAFPLIAVVHQPPGGMTGGPLWRWLQARLDLIVYRRARLLIAASESLAADLEAAGLSANGIRVVAPGRDFGGVQAAAGADLRAGRQVAVLCVANWQPRKGLDQLLLALARLPAEAATLHLVGDDRADPPYAARLRRLLARPDLGYRVVVHGALAGERVAALYASADIFALPSLVEPYGTVYGEAMAAGLPVVGWRAGNLPRLARDGEEAMMLEPGDVPGLSSALRRLTEDASLRRRLGEAAKRTAARLPTWSQSAARFFSMVREAIGDG